MLLVPLASARMTARGAVRRQKARGQGAYINLRAVILATPDITATGCDDGGDGNPEEQRQLLWACTHQQQQDGSSLPVTSGASPGTTHK